MASKTKNRANILSVALRLMLLVLFCGAAYAVYRHAGAEKPGMTSIIIIGVLLLCAAAVLVQLVIWAFIWVKHERVSELGLHIVRYAVILTAVALCLFILLSVDYMELYSETHMNELRQNVISGSVYMQQAIGDSVKDDAQYFSQLQQAADELLLDTEENANRHVCLYLKTDALSTGTSDFASFDDKYLGISTSSEIPCGADTEVLNLVLSQFSVEYCDDLTVGTYMLVSAYAPVFSINGEPVGVLEICETKQIAAGVFRFATLELCLKLLSLVAFFSFMFYGCMQFVDIVLRPRRFDRSRKVLSCGRESVRPILFFITLSASLPVMMLLFAENIRTLASPWHIPFELGSYIPFMVYAAGIAAGQLFCRENRSTLSEIPADGGMILSFLCNLALCLFMDWDALSGLGLSDNVIFMLALIFLCGFGYGIAYRITAKFQAQSDALFGYDKYVYLCSCLGTISGIILGSLIIENYSNVMLRIVSCILTAFTAVIAILLLEDLKSTVEIDESSKDTLTSYAGGMVGIAPVGLACCYCWIYLSEYMYSNGISTAAIGFCAAMPIISFCFGNRLRLRHRFAQRASIAISAGLAGLSFIPMALLPSFTSAVISCAIICVAVIFAASGIYSTAHTDELKKLTVRAIPLLLAGMVAAILALTAGNGSLELFIAAGIAGVSAIIFLLSKYPSRSVVESALPALTAGAGDDASLPSQAEQKKELAEPKIAADKNQSEMSSDSELTTESADADNEQTERSDADDVLLPLPEPKKPEVETNIHHDDEGDTLPVSDGSVTETNESEQEYDKSEEDSEDKHKNVLSEDESEAVQQIDTAEQPAAESPPDAEQPVGDAEMPAATTDGEAINAEEEGEEFDADSAIKAALARAEAAKRAKEKWQRYSENAAHDNAPDVDETNQ